MVIKLKTSKPLFFLIILFFLLSANPVVFGVQIGSGGYSTSLPSGEAGPSNYTGSSVNPLVSSGFSGHIQTNDFWSSLTWDYFDQPYSQNMYPHPLALRAGADGLGITYSTYNALNNEYHNNYAPEDMRISISGLNASNTTVSNYSDWAVTAEWSGSSSMQATFGRGLPFVYFTKSGGNVKVSITTGFEAVWHSGDEILGIQANGHYYAIFAPSGSAWTGSNPAFQSTLDGKDYFSVAVLPDTSPATLEFYRKRAYAFVTNTKVSWSYNESTCNLRSTFSVTTSLKESGNSNVNEPLMALYRHQWLNSHAVNTSYTYSSPRGEMRVFAGSSFSTDITFHGVLPAMPDAGNYDRTRLYNYVNDVYTSGPFIDSGDTYWGGKDAGRLSQLVWIADQVGHTSARDTFLSHIKTALEDWFDEDDGGSKLFYYNSTWDVLIGYPSSYGSNTEINDHDFHYGYWLMAAATVANFDSRWAGTSNWGGMTELMIRDVATWDRNDSLFPFLRCMDPYAGHGWASGHSGFAAGNNQESSSEAMNFNTGVILWGAATGNTTIRDMGIFLYVNQEAAIDQYWFDVDSAVFPSGFDYKAIGILWDNGGAYATWWSPAPEEIHGINFLPFTGGSLYLGHDTSYVTRNYNFMVQQNGGLEDFWHDLIWNYQAFVNPADALNKFESTTFSVEDGESMAHTYHWLSNLESMGQVATGITADSPTYAVFNNNNTLTYVAYNPGSSAMTVNFSDKASLTVPAGSISTGNGSSNPTAAPGPTSDPTPGTHGYTFTGTLPNGLINGSQVAYTSTASFDGSIVTVTFDGGDGFEWVWLYIPGHNAMTNTSGSLWTRELSGYSEGDTLKYYFTVRKDDQEANNVSDPHTWVVRTDTVTPVPTSEPTSEPVGTPGDVNEDNAVDIVDALLTAQYYVGLNPSGFNPDLADVNCDNAIDIVDALLIAQFYVGLISGFC